MQVLIETKRLKAALLVAAKKDIRAVLNGVCLDFINPESVVIVGTDGACLLASTQSISYEELPINSFTYQIVIPRERLELALKKAPDFIVLSKEGSSYSLNDIGFTPMDWTYPQYTRVIPSSVINHSSPVQYDANIMQRLDEALRIASGNAAPSFLFHNGTNAGVMQNHDHSTIGVIMPYMHINANAHLADFRGWKQPNTKAETAPEPLAA